jgi:hypothetical protein
MKEEKHIYARYANTIGIAGDTFFHNQGASKPKNRAQGITIKIPVPTLIGLPLVFCQRPPRQNTVFPSKYW